MSNAYNSNLITRIIKYTALVVFLLATSAALAHWCDCLWQSRYNIVVRPVDESVTFDQYGQAQLRLYVQNNMGYPLINFELIAYSAVVDGPIDIERVAPKLEHQTQPNSMNPSYEHHYLLPGEKQHHTLNINRRSGNTTPELAIEDIKFYVHFNHPYADATRQYGGYGDGNGSGYNTNPSLGVIIRKTSGIVPSTPVFKNYNDGNEQSWHLRSLAKLDFGDSSQQAYGINQLFAQYCSGRKSQGTYGGLICNTTNTNCCFANGVSYGTGDSRCTTTIFNDAVPSKYEASRLYAVAALASRKAALNANQIIALRERLRCGWYDLSYSYRGMSAFLLGYLDPDGSAMDTDSKTMFINEIQNQTDANVANMARAAIYMMNFGDYSQTSPDISITRQSLETIARTTSNNAYVRVVCAAALAFVHQENQYVEDVIIPNIYWGSYSMESSGNDGPETARGLFTAHVLDVLAWQRRGWQEQATDEGDVTFYDTVPDTINPLAPDGLECQNMGTPTNPYLRVQWDAVTLDEDLNPEPGACKYNVTYQPSNGSISNIANSYVEPASLTPGTEYNFSIVAVDTSSNLSSPATISCTAPIPQHAPVAVLSCTPTSVDLPTSGGVDVTCDCDDSTDADGNIASCIFQQGANTQTGGLSNPVVFHFDTASNYTIGLTVTDDTDLSDIAEQVNIAITDQSGNHAPIANIEPATATCGLYGTVQLIGSGSDVDIGDTLSYEWSFGNPIQTATSQNLNYQCNSVGNHTISLVVRDSGGLTGNDFAIVTVVDNQAPVLDSASVAPIVVRPNVDVTFNASGVYDPEDHDFNIVWDFGDGQTSSATNVTHSYSTIGVYTVSLTATDTGEPVASNSREWTITVSDQTNHAPNCAAATVTPLSGKAPLTVNLDASGCTDPDGNTLKWRWAISSTTNDSSAIYNTETQEHLFNAGGSYTITLNVTDDGIPAMQAAQRSFAVEVAGNQNNQSSDTTIKASGCNSNNNNEAKNILLSLIIIGLILIYRRRWQRT